jgi:hypothetical protein
MNPFAYGTAEHLGYELVERFGSAELPAYVLWHGYIKNQERDIVQFLGDVLDRYGVEIAQFCALYLVQFSQMPAMMDTTRERLILGLLDPEPESEKSSETDL